MKKAIFSKSFTLYKYDIGDICMLIEGNYNSFFGSVNPYKTEPTNSVSKPMDSKYAKAMSNDGSIFSLAKDKGLYQTDFNSGGSTGSVQKNPNNRTLSFLG